MAGADGTDAEIACKMKGGEAAVTTFRRAAMDKEDVKSLRLDVRGVIAESGEEPFKRLKMTECEIGVR